MGSASILLVDDDELFRSRVGEALRAAGHPVREAADGVQAIRILEAETPDLLITDMIMPGTDGVELIMAVRRRYPALRILAISGRPDLAGLDLLNLATVLGAQGVLAKPFSTDDLRAKVAVLGDA
jgi:CheY-like chemotaxis protein